MQARIRRQVLANGNRRVGWGRGGGGAGDAATGEEPLVVWIVHDGRRLPSQTYRVGFDALEEMPR